MVAHFARSELSPGPAPLHTHDFHELFWIESGRGIMATPDGHLALAPGSFCLVHAADQHGFAARPGERLQIANLAFSVQAWNILLQRYWQGEDPLQQPLARRINTLDAAELGSLRLAARDLDLGRRDALACDHLLLAALNLLRERPGREALPRWLHDGLESLEQGRWRTGTQALVRASGRSREHVARVCRELLGTTPTALVTDARLRHFARRLVETNTPIAELAAETGLTNLAHLYRLFHRAFGVAPGAWRQRHREVVGG